MTVSFVKQYFIYNSYYSYIYVLFFTCDFILLDDCSDSE